MPVLGHRVQDGEAVYHFSDFFVAPTTVPQSNALGGVNVITIPIVPDFTAEESRVSQDDAASLHDRVSGNAWTLQRIVGKAHLQCIANDVARPASEVWNNIAVTLGFLVAASDDTDQNNIRLQAIEKDPQQVDNASNPWIWRRTWILGNPAGDTNVWFTNSTAEYGSVADGPHIDSKVKRFINREHRLWLTIQARGFDPRIFVDVTGNPETQPACGGLIDLRVYGSLRRQRNGSSF